jgi:hypothetical protein
MHIGSLYIILLLGNCFALGFNHLVAGRPATANPHRLLSPRPSKFSQSEIHYTLPLLAKTAASSNAINQPSTSTLTLVTFSRGDIRTTGGDEAFLTFTPPTSPLPQLLPTTNESLKTTLGRFRRTFTARKTLASSSCTTNNFRQGCTRGINARRDRYMPRSSCECIARGGTMVISVRLGRERSAASKSLSSAS